MILLLLPGCAMVRFHAEVDGVGAISKTVIAIGNSKIQQASQQVQGKVTKNLIEFESQSKTQLEVEETILELLKLLP